MENLSQQKMEEFDQLSKPLADWIHKRQEPYGIAIISSEAAILTQGLIGIPQADTEWDELPKEETK